MGNYQFTSDKTFPPGSLATIKHNKFTYEYEIPKDILMEGHTVKVLKTQNILKSRPNSPDITICTIMFRNGNRDAYFVNNLEPKGPSAVH